MDNCCFNYYSSIQCFCVCYLFSHPQGQCSVLCLPFYPVFSYRRSFFFFFFIFKSTVLFSGLWGSIYSPLVFCTTAFVLLTMCLENSSPQLQTLARWANPENNLVAFKLMCILTCSPSIKCLIGLSVKEITISILPLFLYMFQWRRALTAREKQTRRHAPLTRQISRITYYIYHLSYVVRWKKKKRR